MPMCYKAILDIKAEPTRIGERTSLTILQKHKYWWQM